VVEFIEMPTTIGTTFVGVSGGGVSLGGGGTSFGGGGLTSANFTGGGILIFGFGGSGSGGFGGSTLGGSGGGSGLKNSISTVRLASRIGAVSGILKMVMAWAAKEIPSIAPMRIKLLSRFLEAIFIHSLTFHDTK
jgi:hypothetical protein